MTLFFAAIAGFGLACAVWLLYGWLLLPVRCPVRVEVSATGAGEGLEQAVKGLLWLQKNRLWKGTISIRDDGLTPEGIALALALSRQSGLEFVGRVYH